MQVGTHAVGTRQIALLTAIGNTYEGRGIKALDDPTLPHVDLVACARRRIIEEGEAGLCRDLLRGHLGRDR